MPHSTARSCSCFCLISYLLNASHVLSHTAGKIFQIMYLLFSWKFVCLMMKIWLSKPVFPLLYYPLIGCSFRIGTKFEQGLQNGQLTLMKSAVVLFTLKRFRPIMKMAPISSKCVLNLTAQFYIFDWLPVTIHLTMWCECPACATLISCSILAVTADMNYLLFLLLP